MRPRTNKLCLTAGFILVAAMGVAVWVTSLRVRSPDRRQSNAAIAAAQSEAKRHGLKRSYVVDVHFSNQTWTVELQGRPAVYGGHATVVVAEDGTVLAYKPGL